MGKILIINGANFEANAVTKITIDSDGNELMPKIYDGFASSKTDITGDYTTCVVENSTTDNLQIFKIILTNKLPTPFTQGNYSIYLPYGLYYKICTMNEDCTVYNRTSGNSIQVPQGGKTFITDELQVSGTEYWCIYFAPYDTPYSNEITVFPQDLLEQITISIL